MHEATLQFLCDSPNQSKVLSAYELSVEAGVSLQGAHQDLLFLTSLGAASIGLRDFDVVFTIAAPAVVRSVVSQYRLKGRISKMLASVRATLFLGLKMSFGVFLLLSLSVSIVGICFASRDLGWRHLALGCFFCRRRSNSHYDIVQTNPSAERNSADPEGVRISAESGSREPDSILSTSFFLLVFRFLFGETDPNSNFEERKFEVVASMIKRNFCVICAEQAAPFLDCCLIPSQTPWCIRTPEREVHEGFMARLTHSFEGTVQATESGQLLYNFKDSKVIEALTQRNSSISPPPTLEMYRSFSSLAPKENLLVQGICSYL